MRVKVDFFTTSKTNYLNFCNSYPDLNIPFEKWKEILYRFNEEFRDYILETGDRIKLPHGFGEFSINKKKRRRFKSNGEKEFINLPIDWKKTKEKGKIIYNFNHHTEGYFFGWMWFKEFSRLKYTDLFYFKPSRLTSRKLSEFLNTDNKYQHIYKEWNIKKHQK